MSASLKVVVVSGGNRGIGKEIVKGIAQSKIAARIIIYALSRQGAALDYSSPDATIHSVAVDIAKKEDIANLVKRIKQDHNRLDILINNAAIPQIAGDHSKESAQNIFETNFRGTLDMCRALIPLMPKGSRIVNVTSSVSQMQKIGESVEKEIASSDLTMPDVEKYMQQYVQGVPDNIPPGWSTKDNSFNPAYGVSKIGVNLLTRVLAKEHPEIQINCCCPGVNTTDMMKNDPTLKSPSDGARIVLRCAIGDIGTRSGIYWANASPYSKEDGEERNWINVPME